MRTQDNARRLGHIGGTARVVTTSNHVTRNGGKVTFVGTYNDPGGADAVAVAPAGFGTLRAAGALHLKTGLSESFAPTRPL